MKNTSKITACLPIPKAARESIEWGVITFPLPEFNETIACQEKEIIKNITETKHREEGVYGNPTVLLEKSRCNKKPNSQFISISKKNGKEYIKCIYNKEININRQVKERKWDCRETDHTAQKWDTVWSMSILQKFQYIGNISWCFRWTGKQNVTKNIDSLLLQNGAGRDIIKNVPWWDCTTILDCDSNPEEIPILPVKIALKACCACRGFVTKGNHSNFSDNHCKHSTVHSMGHFIWAASDGTWTTHLAMNGPVKEITMGLPTLCPIWKKITI